MNNCNGFIFLIYKLSEKPGFFKYLFVVGNHLGDEAFVEIDQLTIVSSLKSYEFVFGIQKRSLLPVPSS
ncbi:hypothetical protein [uncultured Cyclobacterium sp.]|uniref:hypothetical protein n=1 Tax=uncultured Cyclobacterium sp. TaxID=453820 RepID=UPI0030ECDDFC